MSMGIINMSLTREGLHERCQCIYRTLHGGKSVNIEGEDLRSGTYLSSPGCVIWIRTSFAQPL